MHSKKCYNESIIKLFWLKHKRATLIVCAALFLVALFVVKNGLLFVNKLSPEESAQKNALIYGDATVADLVSKDTDGDGVPDWEEPLWGLDPTQRETVAGVPDISTVNKLKAEEGIGQENNENPETLTETDKFSRELFSSVAALNQSGALDQAAVDKISDSLAEHVKNSTPRKIYTLSEINVGKNDNVQDIQTYANTLAGMRQKYSVNTTVLDVLQKFIVDKDTVDPEALSQLDHIITQTKALITAMLKMSAPPSLASLHLEVINSLQRLAENMSDIQFYEKDAIVALSGISKYEKNTTLLQSAVINLGNMMSQKLNN